MTQYVIEDWRAALGLRRELETERWPSARPERAVDAGEYGFVRLETRLDQLVGIPLAFVGSDPSTHAAAQQWAPLLEGSLWLTQHRVLVSGAGEISLGWAGLRSLGPDLEGVVFAYDSGTYLVRTHAPVWLDTMIRAVAFHHVSDTQPPGWVARQLARG